MSNLCKHVNTACSRFMTKSTRGNDSETCIFSPCQYEACRTKRSTSAHYARLWHLHNLLLDIASSSNYLLDETKKRIFLGMKQFGANKAFKESSDTSKPCKITLMDPWNPSIQKYYQKLPPLECIKSQYDLTRLLGNVFDLQFLNKSFKGTLLIDPLEKAKLGCEITCNYRCYDKIMGEDVSLNYSEWITFSVRSPFHSYLIFRIGLTQNANSSRCHVRKTRYFRRVYTLTIIIASYQKLTSERT